MNGRSLPPVDEGPTAPRYDTGLINRPLDQGGLAVPDLRMLRSLCPDNWPDFSFTAHPMNLARALIPVCLAASTLPGQAQSLFKCVQDGKTTYQAQPCPEVAKQATVRAPAPPPAAPGSGADRSEVDRVIEFMSTYRSCADAVTIWREEMAKPYEAWRSRNAAIVSRIENDSQLHARYLQRVEAKRSGKASMCRPVGLELRGVKQ